MRRKEWLLVLGGVVAAGVIGAFLRARAQAAEREQQFQRHYQQAQKFISSQNFSGVVHELEAALKYQPDNFETLLELGRAYQMQNGGFIPPRVVQLLEDYVRRHPNEDNGLMELGIICSESYSLLGYDKAETYLRRFIERHPDDADAQYWLGVTLLRAGKFEAALAAHERVLKMDPERALALYGKAILLYKLGRFGEAATVMRQVLEQDPLPEHRLFLYRIYEKLGGYPADLPEEFRFSFKGYHPADSPVKFVESGKKAGVDKPIVARGSGWADYDGDGDLDLLVASSLIPLALYRNNGDGTFTDVAQSAGLADALPGWSTLWADYDNDGDPDLFVGRNGWGGPQPNSLFRNNGDGTFTDAAEKAGVADPTHAAFTAAWGDYDNDGWLDLYVAHFDGAPNALFHNNKDGTFTDVADKAGVAGRESTIGCCWGDYDNDGWLDIYVVNLNQENRLYRNKGDGTFEDVTRKAGVSLPFVGYVCFFLDYDNDGWLDLFASGWHTFHLWAAWAESGEATEFLRWCRLYRNKRDGTFEDVTEKAGLKGGFGAMSAGWGDVDGDGRQDIFLACGGPDFARVEESVLFLNRGNGAFANVSRSAGGGYVGKLHGTSFADYDNDGDLDIFAGAGAVHAGDKWRSALYENQGAGNNWLVVRTRGVQSNRDGIGAKVKAIAGDLMQYAEVNGGGGFGVTNSLQLELGLGKQTLVDRLEVYWPSGIQQVFKRVPVNQAILVKEDERTYQKAAYRPLNKR